VGAAGNIAVEMVARSPADGSVLAGAIAAPIVTNPMFMKLNIDPLKELAPVTVLGTTPSVVIASKKSGARSLPDFIAMLRKDPGKYTFSSVGIGTTGHLSVELIALKSGTKMVHVPYKSTPEAMQAVMTGEVDIATLTVNLAEPAILADKVNGLAITSARRWPTLPDIPTIAEAGVPEMAVDAWFGLFAPAKTPPAIIEKIAREVKAVEEIPEVRKRIEGVYYRPAANTPAEFAALLRQEQVIWKRVVDTIGLKPPQ
jgi:tripartite-type tricarboxylate transporter receptor subunit TctC